jgi:hypothetical protein
VDIEVSEAIKALRIELHEVEVRLSARIDAAALEVRDQLGEEIVESGMKLRGEMAELSTTLRGEMGGLGTILRGEFRDGLAENRRHAEVLVETVRDDIRIVAEGVVALTAKVDALARGR